MSLWNAMGEVIQRQLLPPRALAALKSFRSLIEDARAMLTGNLVEHLEDEAGVERAPSPPEEPETGAADGADFDPDEFQLSTSARRTEETDEAIGPLEAAAETTRLRQ